MKFVNIKISRRPELISGIQLQEGNDWIVLLENPVDYVLDGYAIINKKFIKSIVEPFNKDNFKYKIFNMKYKNVSNNQYFELDTCKDLISLLEKTDKLIGLELESADYNIVGKISKINDKSFVLRMFGVKGVFLREENFKYSSIRQINIDTDYLLSLENYLREYKA